MPWYSNASPDDDEVAKALENGDDEVLEARRNAVMRLWLDAEEEDR